MSTPHDGDSLGTEMSDVDEQPRTLLVTLTGKDRPGVTSAMFATLSAAGVEVLDIEQIVLRFLDAVRAGEWLSAEDALRTHELCERIVNVAQEAGS